MPKLERIYALDVLRGIAALSVVIFHWQHFFVLGGEQSTSLRDFASYPLYSLLALFYHKGGHAVDFFFAISGYVFAYVYADSVRARTISVWDFFFYRISRLYPLHLATLLLVLAMQAIFIAHSFTYFVYQDNTSLQFIASLLLIQQWRPGALESFNGPSWSISIEVALYILFYVLVRNRLVNDWRHAGVAALCGVLVFVFDREFGRGIMGFFIGVAVFMMLLRIRLDLLRKAKNAIFVAAILGWTSVLLEFKFGALHHLAHLGFGFVSPNAQSFFDRFSNGAFLIIFDFTVVPATIAAAALYERVSPVSLKRLHWIGDISYSSYLLHFPLQLFFAILMVAGTAPLTWRTSGWFMLSFYFLLIPLSFATFCYFERPTQNWLRQKWRALSGTGRGPARAGGPHTAERRD